MTSSWDPKKYMLSNEAREMRLKIGDDEILIKVRNLPWSKKNQLVSQCLKWDSSGATVFDGDQYIKESLKYMVVEAPWGSTNEVFLAQVGPALGAALEALVPRAFAGEQISVEEVKKD